MPQGRNPVEEKAIQECFKVFGLLLPAGLTNVRRRPWRSSYPLSSCTPDDTIKFLISKDKSGRTAIHAPACSGAMCQCYRRLAAGTIDSLLGKLRSTFNGLGRLEQTNPITHPRIKEYLKFVREEQAGLAVTPFTSRAVFLC